MSPTQRRTVRSIVAAAVHLLQHFDDHIFFLVVAQLDLEAVLRLPLVDLTTSSGMPALRQRSRSLLQLSGKKSSVSSMVRKCVSKELKASCRDHAVGGLTEPAAILPLHAGGHLA
jgi:hypothetical protein